MSVTGSQIRAEGFWYLGALDGTSVVFVRTKRTLRLFHVSELPGDRGRLALAWKSRKRRARAEALA